jgi:hypothetical protein
MGLGRASLITRSRPCLRLASGLIPVDDAGALPQLPAAARMMLHGRVEGGARDHKIVRHRNQPDDAIVVFLRLLDLEVVGARRARQGLAICSSRRCSSAWDIDQCCANFAQRARNSAAKLTVSASLICVVKSASPSPATATLEPPCFGFFRRRESAGGFGAWRACAVHSKVQAVQPMGRRRHHEVDHLLRFARPCGHI